MKPEILMMGPMMPHVEAALDESYTVHRLFKADNKDALLAEAGPRIRGIATDGGLGASADLMGKLPALEIVSCYGVGVDAIDLGHAKSQGVTVTNTPDVLNDDVANLAVALVLATSRTLVANDSYVRQGRWQSKGAPPLARSIRGAKIGILGLGRIGKDIAGKMQVFGCEIAYHGRSKQDVPYEYFDNLTDMARAVDYLIAICPGGPSTNKIVNAEVLEALGKDGTFINVARGSVHDETALVSALYNGTLGAAGLDVFENEPGVPEALLTMDNVVLQPHQGSGTVETRRAMGDLVIENLRRHFKGEPVKTPVT